MKLEYQLTLRIPEKLADKLRQRTIDTKRSMNAEIINMIEYCIDKEDSSNATKLRDIIANAESVLSSLK